ncbi:tetratricopeptide repeat protein [Lacipirellula limnantheis]|uniref:Tetratricopeptide repeat protein n=1 Tax=Lacipirellula limnantheis TaxID=2528024 RepID=A0A517TT01_9BACT|nr:tetratricopeptide repeat protein [Lacipirellula limnantheis]QDT71505.1 Tetratricopeptide repeat protein [Lacipirellula limnantheis]
MPKDLSGVAAELASVRHLIALGYEDPLDVAAREASVARSQQATLHSAEELLKRDAPTEAIAVLEPMLDAPSDWPAPHHLLARAYFRTGQWGAAEEQLRWLECRGVEHAELALLRARLALRRRSLAAARDHAEYASRLQSPLPAADALIGEVELRRGNLIAAEEAYRRASAAAGPQGAAWVGMAAMAFRRGDVAAAVDAALRAIEQEPRLATAHYWLGMALVQMQRPFEATAALRAAATLGPNLAAPYRLLARLAAEQGDFAAAGEYRQLGRAVIARRHAGRKN